MKLAVVGRRNVGKSTLINHFCGTDRVIVSEVPGTTRDAVDAPSVIAVLRLDASGFTSFLSDCRAQPGQQVDLARIRQILERLHSLVSTTQGRVAQAEADCASSQTGLTTAEGQLVGIEAL